MSTIEIVGVICGVAIISVFIASIIYSIFVAGRRIKLPPPPNYYDITENGRGEFFVYMNYSGSGYRFILNSNRPFASLSDAKAYIDNKIYVANIDKEKVIWKQSAG